MQNLIQRAKNLQEKTKKTYAKYREMTPGVLEEMKELEAEWSQLSEEAEGLVSSNNKEKNVHRNFELYAYVQSKNVDGVSLVIAPWEESSCD